MSTNAPPDSSSLSITTYNIQLSLHPDIISENLLKLTKQGALIICLQEVVNYHDGRFIINHILNRLGPDWQAINHIGPQPHIQDMGNAIIFHRHFLNLLNYQHLLLPRAPKLVFHEKAFSYLAGGLKNPILRRSITATFKFHHTPIRITNLHLDPTGGLKHRQKQLLNLKDTLNHQPPVHQEIICGDFNSFDLLKTGREAAMHQHTLGNNFTNASQHIDWTGDLNRIDTKHATKLMRFLITNAHLHLRRKLDHIYTQGFNVHHCCRLPYTGSDHQPILAHLTIDSPKLNH